MVAPDRREIAFKRTAAGEPGMLTFGSHGKIGT
jgi:hypothetical protein